MKVIIALAGAGLIAFLLIVLIAAILVPRVFSEQAKIAFTRSDKSSLNSDIYVMGSDGSDPTRLTDNEADDSQPVFSPGGSEIAFTSNRDWNDEIYVMDSDGSDPTRLTNNNVSDYSLDFSSDGLREELARDPRPEEARTREPQGESKPAKRRTVEPKDSLGEGEVGAWGGNEFGQLGDGTTFRHGTPERVVNISNAEDVAAGKFHNLALTEDDTVWTWGGNLVGQLGDGTTKDRTTPVHVSGLSDVKAVAAGGSHSLALIEDGTVWAWGDNAYGQLGDRTTTNRTAPVQVRGLDNIEAVDAGQDHSLAIHR
jgi:dipeptidyl aminopeptidase/acylaminoacyl peptidase